MSKVTIKIDMTDSEDMLFFRKKTTPEIRRQIIDIGTSVFEHSNEILHTNHYKHTLDEFKENIKKELDSRLPILEKQTIEQKKIIALLKEQLDIANSRLSREASMLSSRIDETNESMKTILNNPILCDTTSSGIGKLGEITLFKALNERYPTFEFIDAHAEGHQGDIHCLLDDDVKVMIDSKNFKKNVGKKDREKFYEDMRANPSFSAGILFSHKSGIATKNDLDMELVDNKLVVYICNGANNLSKLDLVFHFIKMFVKQNKKLDIKKLDVISEFFKNAKKSSNTKIKKINELKKIINILENNNKEDLDRLNTVMKLI